MEDSSNSKAIHKPSYADAVHLKDSKKEGMSQTCLPRLVGSHKQSRDFLELIGGSIFNNVKCHSVTRHVELAQINDELKRVASSDRLSDPLDIDGTNLGNGLEERVGLANLINDNNSFFAGVTASGDSNPDLCIGETGSSLGNRGNMSEMEEINLGRGGVGGFEVGPEVGRVKAVVAEEGGDCGACNLQCMGWVGLGFNLSPLKASVVPGDSSSLPGGPYISSEKKFQNKVSSVKKGGSRKKRKTMKKAKCLQLEGSGGTQRKGQAASPLASSKEDHIPAVLKEGEVM
ncbi:hypothetical protein Ancab_001922, partial [Ancistrocladus abbreviatus]